MTYNVFDGTLNLAQSNYQFSRDISQVKMPYLAMLKKS